MAWKREDWNDIIQRVNALDCIGSPLPLVEPSHILTKSDIQTIRDKLNDICTNHPTFSQPLRKWKQSVVDEINAAIDDCECNLWPGMYSIAVSPIISFWEGEETSGNVWGCGICTQYSCGGSVVLGFNNLQLGPAGIKNRYYIIFVGTSTSGYAATLLWEDGICRTQNWTGGTSYYPGYRNCPSSPGCNISKCGALGFEPPAAVIYVGSNREIADVMASVGRWTQTQADLFVANTSGIVYV